MATTEELRILFKTIYDEEGAKKAVRGLDAVDESAKKAVSVSDKLKTAVGAAGAAFGTLAATGAALAVVWNEAERGLQISATRDRFVALNESIGVLADDTLARLRESTRSSITDFELMENAGNLLNLGVAKTQDELVSTIDQVLRLKPATVSATEAIDNFTKLVANQSIDRLDELGISGAATRATMDELQQSIAGLTREEAFNIALQEQMQVALERVGQDGIPLNVTGFQRLRTEVENTRNEISEFIGGALDPLILRSFETADRVAEAEQAIANQRRELMASSATWSEYVDNLKTAGLRVNQLERDEYELVQTERERELALQEAAAAQDRVTAAQERAQSSRINAFMEENGHLLENAAEQTTTLAYETERYTQATNRNIVTQERANRERANSTRLAEREAQVNADRAMAIEAAREAAVLSFQAELAATQAANERAAASRAASSSLFMEADANRELGSVLFETALAEGITATETALLAQEFTNLTDEQIKAQIAAAALQVKEQELGEALAAGNITIAEAIDELNAFQESLNSSEGDVYSYAAGVDELTGNAREASSAVRDTALALDELDGKTVSASVTVRQTNLSTGIGDGLIEARSRGGAGFPGASFLVGERGPELVTLPAGARVQSTTETNNFIMNLSTRETTAGVIQNFGVMRAAAGRV